MSSTVDSRSDSQKPGPFAGWRKRIPILSPALVFIVIFAIGGVLYRNFFSLQVLLNLFTDNAFLGSR